MELTGTIPRAARDEGRGLTIALNSDVRDGKARYRVVLKADF